MTLLKPVVVNGVTKANAELFNEYGDDLETIANTMLGTGAITESQLATAVSKRLVPTGGSTGQYLKWKENGTAEWSTGAGLSKAEAETLAQEAVKKAELPGAVAVVTVNSTLSGIPAKSQTDEVAIIEGNIVLVPFQTNEKERGLWEVKSGAWVRPAGFETGKELPLGVTVAVAEGKEYKGSIWDFENKTRVIVGTTAQVWNTNSAGGTVGSSEIESKVHLRYSFQGGSMAIGPGAGETLLGLSRIEQEKHNSHILIGENAGQHLSGIIAGPIAPGAELASGKTEFTTPSGQNEENWHLDNVPNVTFTEVTPGCGLETEVLYWCVGVTHEVRQSWTGFTGTKFKLVKGRGYPISYTNVIAVANGTFSSAEEKALEEAGLAKSEMPKLVTLAGTMKPATTRMQVSESTEDNIIIGRTAANSLTTGGGNILIGERVGFGITRGEENIALGTEALRGGTETSNCVAIGHESCAELRAGFANVAIGWQSGFAGTATSRNVFVGTYAGKGAQGSDNVAVGVSTLQTPTGEGALNVILGNEAGGSANSQNIFIGCNAGQANTKSKNVFIGTFAGTGTAEASYENRLIISMGAHNSEAAGLITGKFPNAELALNAAKLGFNGKAPATLVAESLETGALKATKVTPYGFETEAQALAVVKFCEKFSKWAHESGLTA